VSLKFEDVVEEFRYCDGFCKQISLRLCSRNFGRPDDAGLYVLIQKLMVDIDLVGAAGGVVRCAHSNSPGVVDAKFRALKWSRHDIEIEARLSCARDRSHFKSFAATPAATYFASEEVVATDFCIELR
jgi:hypothetical protein